MDAFWAGVIALFSSLGCGSQRDLVNRPNLPHGSWQPTIDVRVYVTDDFTTKEHANIVNGVMMWERATAGMVTWTAHVIGKDELPNELPQLQLDGSQKLVVVFHKGHSSDDWVKHWDANSKTGSKLLGMCFGDFMTERTGVWLVMDRLKSDFSQVWTAAHEFGHALGLKHVADKSSMMSEFYNWTVKGQTLHDMHEFCTVWGCDDEAKEAEK